MKYFLKMLFPKLWFGLDDQNLGGGVPEGQPPADDGNAPAPAGDEPSAPSPTDFVEFQSTKISKSDFEAKARELYKDEFEARANRDKWQAENTRKAQELKQLERDAEAFRALKADQNRPQPKNEYEAMKEEYIREKSEFYPDADPNKLRSFLAKEFDWNAKLAGYKANETVQPLHQRQAEEFESKFLAEHPKVQRGSQQYQEIAQLVGQGVNAEKAYQIVFQDDILKEKTEAALKARDEERLKKLKANQPNSQQGDKPVTGTRSEKIWRALEKSGISRE